MCDIIVIQEKKTFINYDFENSFVVNFVRYLTAVFLRRYLTDYFI